MLGFRLAQSGRCLPSATNSNALHVIHTGHKISFRMLCRIYNIMLDPCVIPMYPRCIMSRSSCLPWIGQKTYAVSMATTDNSGKVMAETSFILFQPSFFFFFFVS